MPPRQIETEALVRVEDALRLCGCQFWACHGPTLEPVAMATCARCCSLAEVRVALGLPIRDEAEQAYMERRDAELAEVVV